MKKCLFSILIALLIVKSGVAQDTKDASTPPNIPDWVHRGKIAGSLLFWQLSPYHDLTYYNGYGFMLDYPIRRGLHLEAGFQKLIQPSLYPPSNSSLVCVPFSVYYGPEYKHAALYFGLGGVFQSTGILHPFVVPSVQSDWRFFVGRKASLFFDFRMGFYYSYSREYVLQADGTSALTSVYGINPTVGVGAGMWLGK